MKKLAVFSLFAVSATAQILTLEPKTQLDIGLQGARQFGGSISATHDKYGLETRSLGSAWDVGASYRALRATSYRGGSAVFFDLGGTVYYGSEKVKGGGSMGLMIGDSDSLNFWVRGTGGNFWSTSFGANLGRVAISGTRGNYFGDRADLFVAIDQNHKYWVGGGWSSLVGFVAQVKTTITFKK